MLELGEKFQQESRTLCFKVGLIRFCKKIFVDLKIELHFLMTPFIVKTTKNEKCHYKLSSFFKYPSVLNIQTPCFLILSIILNNLNIFG